MNGLPRAIIVFLALLLCCECFVLSSLRIVHKHGVQRHHSSGTWATAGCNRPVDDGGLRTDGRGARQRDGTEIFASASDDGGEGVKLEVVLFGVGDMRVSDHLGLINAVTASCNAATAKASRAFWVPLFVIETEDTLPCLPQSATSLLDSASLLHQAMQSVDCELQIAFSNATNLHVLVGEEGQGIEECVIRGVLEVADHLDEVLRKEISYEEWRRTTKAILDVSIHVCSLGDADNGIGYGPFSALQHVGWDGRHLDPINNCRISSLKVVPWECNLRAQPWIDLDNELFPDHYPTFVKRYTQYTDALPPVHIKEQTGSSMALSVRSLSALPSLECITRCLMRAKRIARPSDEQLLQLETDRNIGLYLTHWGGLGASSLTERDVKSCLRVYCNDCDEKDELFVKSAFWKALQEKSSSNMHSLEHASMKWLLHGENGSQNDHITYHVENLIKGELMVRFLAAPLLFGTISPRQIWHWSRRAPANAHRPPHSPKRPVLQKLAEGREWQRLFAAKNIRLKMSTSGPNTISHGTTFGYWRWHGWLCHYEMSAQALTNTKKDNPSKNDAVDSSTVLGIILIHGFGARGMQWQNTIRAMYNSLHDSSEVAEVAAPDLIGYGHSEKPAITYTEYLWESHASSFLKEVCIRGRGWSDFVIGGNSVGGYTAMAVSADDSLVYKSDYYSTMRQSDGSLAFGSASGAFGTGSCKGLILICTSGPICSKDRDEETGARSVAERVLQGLVEYRRPLNRDLVKCIGKFLFLVMLRCKPFLPSLGKIFYRANPDVMNKAYFDDIIRDSMDPGVINVIVSISKLLPKRTATELLAVVSHPPPENVSKSTSILREGQWLGPVLLIQGYLDPLKGRERAQKLVNLRSGITLVPLQAGHCPHDELPEVVGGEIVKWLERQHDFESTLKANVRL